MSDPDRDEEWRDDALCAQTDPEAFFPEKGGNNAEAERVCLRCDVRAQCLAYAVRNDERFGIWGGLSVRERDRIKHSLPVRPLTRAQAQKRDRDEAIVAMSGHEVDVPTIAAELRVTGRTVHRTLAAHRAQAHEQRETTV